MQDFFRVLVDRVKLALAGCAARELEQELLPALGEGTGQGPEGYVRPVEGGAGLKPAVEALPAPSGGAGTAEAKATESGSGSGATEEPSTPTVTNGQRRGRQTATR